MQHNTPKLAEGDITPAPTNSTIEYTGVTSCLTFTVLYSDGTASGGHAGMMPQPGERSIDQVVADLKTQANGKTISKVVLAGEIGLWEQNIGHFGLPYNNVDAILQDLSPNATVVRYDSANDLNGAGAHMALSPDHQKLIVKSVNGAQIRDLPL